MSRVFVNAQAGRQGKSGLKKEEEWGTTSSQAEFRAYEPAEMRNAREIPQHARTCVENNARGTLPKNKGTASYNWYRVQESFPDHSVYTATEQSLPRISEDRRSQGSSGKRSNRAKTPPGMRGAPAWARTHMNPIPEHKFDATTSYTQHQMEAQLARHNHFPYRDEFQPRSKRLLYELAHQRASCDSVASGSTATASAFTVSSKGSRARSVARSQSEGSIASSHHTADSDKVIGGIAKRRAQVQFRSPALCVRDGDWLRDKWEKEGPAGLVTGNFKPSFYQPSCKQSIEQTHSMSALLGGYKEAEIAPK